MGDLTEHFSRYDFRCKCGCGGDTADKVTTDLAEEVRVYAGVAITPSSGYRCKKHNKKEGGGEKSLHLVGRAVDLPVPDPEDVYEWLCQKYPDQYGFGLYRTFVHVDSRTDGPARWVSN